MQRDFLWKKSCFFWRIQNRTHKKLGEECEEFLKSSVPEELADIIEVVDALKKLPEYSAVEMVRKEKLKERGGFEKKIILKGQKD